MASCASADAGRGFFAAPSTAARLTRRRRCTESKGWRGQPGRFEVQFFHPGFYYREMVPVHVVEPTGTGSERMTELFTELSERWQARGWIG